MRALNSDHQSEVLADLNEHFVGGAYRLLVIDSICALFRVDYIGRGELQDRQSKLGVYLNRVKNMAEEFNLTVLMTNQVQSDPGASALFASADGRKPIGGHVVAHASTTRVLLRKGRGDERVAKIQDSPGGCRPSPRCWLVALKLTDEQIVRNEMPSTSSPPAALPIPTRFRVFPGPEESFSLLSLRSLYLIHLVAIKMLPPTLLLSSARRFRFAMKTPHSQRTCIVANSQKSQRFVSRHCFA